MKKILIAAVMLTAGAANVFAYSFFAGGQFGLKYSSPKQGDSTTVYTVSPYAGYLLNDKSDISVGFSFSDDGTDSDYSVFAAYEYAIAAVDKLTFYISPSLTYTDGDSYTGSEITAAVTPNVQYALSERIGLIATLNFIGLSYTSGDGYSDFILGADANSTITSIGFYFNF